MKNFLPTHTIFAAFFTLFFSIASYAQLPSFTVNLTTTPQTCSGNGSLVFSVSGTAAGAGIDYAVFLLPNLTTSVAVVTSGPVLNMPAGNYRVIATQSLNGEQNTAFADATIQNNAPELNFTLVPTNVRCGNDGKITVNVQTGTAVNYEIIGGPVTRPLQSSNNFSNLPVGQYQVRVFDNCGDATVVTLQLITALPHISLAAAQFGSSGLPSCTTIQVSHFFSSITGYEIFYPLTFVYTVTPPGGGAPIIITNTVVSGTNAGTDVTTTLPFFYNQNYTYNLKVTDACNNSFSRNNNVINKKFEADVKSEILGCGDNYITITPSNFVAPFSVNFTLFPAGSGFNPTILNPAHPDFTTVAVYGAAGNPMPEGSYTVVITDDCNHSVTKTFMVTDPEIHPDVISSVEGCSTTGNIKITIAGRVITEVHITNAPPAYTGPLNVSSFIGSIGFLMNGLPLGEYSFEIKDSCGMTYNEDTELAPDPANMNVTVTQRAGCQEDTGSVRLTIPAGNTLVSVKITQAPAAFQLLHPLPYVASAFIYGENFSINSLPAGNYRFETLDTCGLQRIKDVVIEGYQTTQNDITLIPNCNSFNLKVEHASNGMYIASFWLQKFDPLTNLWGHPSTGNPYIEGTLPGNANSVALNNNATTINLAYLGLFRIVKAFYVFGNGTTTNTRCVQEIHQFEFDGRPVIKNAFPFPCTGGLTEVAIDALGVAPLIYQITTKNDQPFDIYNGTSNIFSGLAPATYNFLVTDDCGNFRNRPFTITELEPIAITETGFCENEVSKLSVQQFSFLHYRWYKAGQEATTLSTTNTLNFPSYTSALQAGTYKVDITTTLPTSCINQTLIVTIDPVGLPNAGNDDSISLCNAGSVLNLAGYLSTPHDNGGVWLDADSTGALNGASFSTAGIAAGTYHFKYVVTGDCGLADEALITIILKAKPAAPVLTAIAPLCAGNNIQLQAATVPNATSYNWTGPNNFTSSVQNPLIAAAGVNAAGNYSVTVTVNGCTSAAAVVPVTINAIPQFTVTGNTLICSGQSSILTVVPGTNFDPLLVLYEWYYNTGLITGANAASVEVFNTGLYRVVVNNNGCTNFVDVNIQENSIAIDMVPEQGCVDEQYILSVRNLNDFPASSFTWTGPEGYSYDGYEANISGLTAGEYFVEVTNADGCTAEASVNVPNTYCKIPKGISPNNDEYNNSFDLTNFDVKEISIFNRYGMKVYEKENYKDEWHGQSFEGNLPTGTYYYVILLHTGKRMTGWVYVQSEVK